jgi:hypothetical protein
VVLTLLCPASSSALCWNIVLLFHILLFLECKTISPILRNSFLIKLVGHSFSMWLIYTIGLQYLRILEEVDVFNFSFQFLTILLMLKNSIQCFLLYDFFNLIDH